MDGIVFGGRFVVVAAAAAACRLFTLSACRLGAARCLSSLLSFKQVGLRELPKTHPLVSVYVSVARVDFSASVKRFQF